MDLSERLLEARLFQYLISSVPGLDLVIDREVETRDWAVPNIVVPFPAANELTFVLLEQLLELRCVVGQLDALTQTNVPLMAPE